MKKRQSFRRIGRPTRDLILILSVSILVFVLTVRTTLFTKLILHQHRLAFMVDQIALLFLILLFGLSIFALRRWRELRKEQSRRKKAESSMQAREDAYKQIIEQADEMIYRTDAKGHFILISPSVEKILKYSEGELIGRHYLGL